ncbi:MAG: hypothetical protein QXW70_00020 [Candidatus Anstonellales archaeon]
MSRVPIVVKKIIEEEPFIDDALDKGLINYTKLAYYLQKRVEREVGGEASIPAIMMALRRVKRRREGKKANIIDFSGCEITVKGSLCEFNYRKDPRAVKKANSLFEIVDTESGDVLNISYGNYEISIVSAEKYAHLIEERMRGERLLSKASGLSFLSIRFPKSLVDSVGFFSLITRALAWHGISIKETISTYTEFILVLKTKDSARAYEILTELFSRKRTFGIME